MPNTPSMPAANSMKIGLYIRCRLANMSVDMTSASWLERGPTMMRIRLSCMMPRVRNSWMRAVNTYAAARPGVSHDGS